VSDTTLTSLLERAAHETTPLPEAINALQAVKRRLAAQGKSLANLVVSELATPSPYRPMFSKGIKSELEELRLKSSLQEKELLEARKEIIRLHHKLERAGGSKRLPKSEDGTMAWVPFSLVASARLGKSHGWKRIFARQFGLKDEGILLSWSKQDRVPSEAVAFLSKLKPESKREAPARRPWMRREYDRLAELLAQGKTENEIVPLLEAEFERTITLGAVKKARQRIRLGQHDRYAADGRLRQGIVRKKKPKSASTRYSTQVNGV
jgi:hypothetical protein